jgi:hypothetical protein
MRIHPITENIIINISETLDFDKITPVYEYVKFWYYKKIQPFYTYFKYKFTANLSLQIQQPDKTYRIGSYSCYENVINRDFMAC